MVGDLGTERTLGTLGDTLNIRKEGDDMCWVSLTFPAQLALTEEVKSGRERADLCGSTGLGCRQAGPAVTVVIARRESERE